MPPPAVASTRISAICFCRRCLHLLRLLHHGLDVHVVSGLRVYGASTVGALPQTGDRSRSLTFPRRPGSPPGTRRAWPARPTTTSPRPSGRASPRRHLAGPCRRRGGRGGRRRRRRPEPTTTGILRPASRSAAASSHGRVCSNCSRSARCVGRNVNVIAVVGDLDPLRLRDDGVVEETLPRCGSRRAMRPSELPAGADLVARRCHRLLRSSVRACRPVGAILLTCRCERVACRCEPAARRCDGAARRCRACCVPAATGAPAGAWRSHRAAPSASASGTSLRRCIHRSSTISK